MPPSPVVVGGRGPCRVHGLGDVEVRGRGGDPAVLKRRAGQPGGDPVGGAGREAGGRRPEHVVGDGAARAGRARAPRQRDLGGGAGRRGQRPRDLWDRGAGRVGHGAHHGAGVVGRDLLGRLAGVADERGARRVGRVGDGGPGAPRKRERARGRARAGDAERLGLGREAHALRCAVRLGDGLRELRALIGVGRLRALPREAALVVLHERAREDREALAGAAALGHVVDLQLEQRVAERGGNGVQAAW